MNELSQLMMPVQPVDPELLAKHTRTVIAPEMQNCAAFSPAPKRIRTLKHGSTYGKNREHILAFLRSHPPCTTLTLIDSLDMHGDHTRRILRELAEDGLAQCLDKGNRGLHIPAIWTAVEEGGEEDD